MKKQSILWMIALAIFICLFTGCTSEETGGNLAGRVFLDGESSHGDITVELFGSGSDEPIWPIITNRPCLGFSYSPQAHFDWRMHHPAYSTTTDGNGNYAISSISDGDYILCARLDSFGWSSPVSVSIHGGDVFVEDITLYPETRYNFKVFEEDTIFELGHHYVFDGLVSIQPGVTLTIEPGTVIRFGRDQQLVIKGTLIALGAPDNWIVWTSDSDTLMSSSWYQMEFQATASRPRFSYNRFEGIHEGINSPYVGGEFENCFFRKVGASCLYLSGTNIHVTNCIFYDIGGTGVTLHTATDPRLEYSLMYDNAAYGVAVNNCNGGIVDHNWITKCGISGYNAGIHFLLSDDVRILHNEITDCHNGINIGSQVDDSNLIQGNYIWGGDMQIGIYIGFTQDNVGPSYPDIHYNCISAKYDSYCLQVASCEWNHQDMQATYNYWDPSVLNPIWDYIDEPEPPHSCPHVFISPQLSSCPDSAGVEC